jgi:hypothetical protein
MLHSPPRLHKNIKAHFKDFAELRETIRSGKMYTFPTLFDLFCSGVEAGNFRNAVPRKPASIDRYMTIAHEANFRTELWFALGKKSFRHQTYPSWLKVRAKIFREFLQLVHEDRKEHLEDAWQTRRGALTQPDDEVNQDSEDDNDSVDGVDIDSSLLT